MNTLATSRLLINKKTKDYEKKIIKYAPKHVIEICHDSLK